MAPRLPPHHIDRPRLHLISAGKERAIRSELFARAPSNAPLNPRRTFHSPRTTHLVPGTTSLMRPPADPACSSYRLHAGVAILYPFTLPNPGNAPPFANNRTSCSI